MRLIAGDKVEAGEVRVEHWGPAARLGRGARALLLLWGLALVSVLIPVAHFLLVPAFLLAGLIVALRRGLQHSGVLGGQGTCPTCRQPMRIEAGPDRWPFFAICGACGSSARIERVPPAT